MTYDWSLCIAVQKKDVLRVLNRLAMQLGDSDMVARIVLVGLFAILRPAEAAARRIIAIAACGLSVAVPVKRAMPSLPIPTRSGAGARVPCFALFDPRRRVDPPRKRVPRTEANVRFFDGLDVAPDRAKPPLPDDLMATARLRRRLTAAIHAMQDIPKQARRLARYYAKQKRPIRPMRPGRPPGFRAGGKRYIDVILANCQKLALIALDEAEAKARMAARAA